MNEKNEGQEPATVGSAMSDRLGRAYPRKKRPDIPRSTHQHGTETIDNQAWRAFLQPIIPLTIAEIREKQRDMGWDV